MSKFVQVKTQLRDVEMVKHALDDLKMSYSEEATYSHRWSGGSYAVPLLDPGRFPNIRAASATKTAATKPSATTCKCSAFKPAVERITQRYAYHMVLAETSEAGFELVEETVGTDNVIR